MSTCANCGAEMGYGTYCPECGNAADAYRAQPDQGYQPAMSQPPSWQPEPASWQPEPSPWQAESSPRAGGAAAGFPLKPDTGSVWWAVLSFFVPYAGIILWAIWRDYKPNDARKCGIGLIVFAAVMTIPLVLGILTLVGLLATGALAGAVSLR